MNSEKFPIKKLENESSKAFEAFCIYCQLPPNQRSIDAAYLMANNGQKIDGQRVRSHFEKWSKDYDWKQRVAEYDQILAAKSFELQLKFREESIKNYHEKFQENFIESLEISEVLLEAIKNRLNRQKSKELPLADLKNLTLAYGSVVASQKVIFEQWSILLGLDQLAYQVAAKN